MQTTSSNIGGIGDTNDPSAIGTCCERSVERTVEPTKIFDLVGQRSKVAL